MAKSFKKLKDQMTPERRDKIEEQAEAILLSMALQELRQARDLTQQELAQLLNVNQAALSKMENQTDIRVSTLRKLLVLAVRLQDLDIRLDQLETKAIVGRGSFGVVRMVSLTNDPQGECYALKCVNKAHV